MKGDSVPKGMAMNRSRMWGEEQQGRAGAATAPMGSTWSLPNPGGATAAEHEALNRGGEALPAFQLLCSDSCSFW